jgi:hypothetical protein
MNSKCPLCGQKFEIEPGFFIGAMYVSYAFTVIEGLIAGFAAYFILHSPSVSGYMAFITTLLILLSPASFRYSRMVMLYLFASIKYDPKAIEKHLG